MKRAMYFAKRTFWFALAIALFVTISHLCYKTLYVIAGRMTYEVSEDVLRAIHIMLSLISFHSFLYAVIFYDKELKRRCEECKMSKLRVAFNAAEPFIMLGISAVAFLAFPNAFSVKMLSGWAEISTAISALIMAVAFLIVHYVTWFECLFKWKKFNSKNDKYGTWQTVKHIISSCLAYPILAYLLPIFFPTFRTFPQVVKVLFIGLFPLILALLLIMLSAPAIRALFIRFSFIRKLKKATKVHGYKLSEIRHPYLSLFTDFDESSFVLEANGKTYTAKLISGMIYSNPMYFDEGGKGRVVNSLRFRMFLYGVRGYGRIGWHNTDELARFETHFTYGFEGEGKKVLIACPTPHSIYATGYGENKLLDIADTVWGYTLMTGTAFINALERDCI